MTDETAGGDMTSLDNAKPEPQASYIHREPGLVLTNASLAQLKNAVSLGGYSMVKVVSGWGIDGGWTGTNMTEVLKLSRYTIVRTVTGDHKMLDADSVIREVSPWYERRALKPWFIEGRTRTLFVEIGNEPNIGGKPGDGGPGFGSLTDDTARREFIFGFKWHHERAIDRLRHEFPELGIVTTSLAPTEHPELHKWISPWLEAMAPSLIRGHFIAFHVYAPRNWVSGGPVAFMVPMYDALFGASGRVAVNKPLIVTEFGLSDGVSHCPRPTGYVVEPKLKGHLYAGLMHFGESDPPLKPNVWGGTYYHLVGEDRQVRGNPYDGYYPNGDRQYRQRINGAQRPPSNRLREDEALHAASNEFLSSSNGQYHLVMQADSNLVLYGPGGAMWSSKTYGAGANHVRMQEDGNLVIYAKGGRPVWASNTADIVNNCGAALFVQDDGNAVIYRAPTFSVPIWWTAGRT